MGGVGGRHGNTNERSVFAVVQERHADKLVPKRKAEIAVGNNACNCKMWKCQGTGSQRR